MIEDHVMRYFTELSINLRSGVCWLQSRRGAELKAIKMLSILLRLVFFVFILHLSSGATLTKVLLPDAEQEVRKWCTPIVYLAGSIV